MQVVGSAIVTGGSRGIGRAIALRLAKAGASVVLVGTNQDSLTGVRDEIRSQGGAAECLAGDVADEALATRAVDLATGRLGPIGTLINNAGINLRTPTLDIDFADWQRVLNVNLNGTLHFCRAVLPVMIANGGGSIVNVSSVAAKAPHRNASPAYGASKAAVNYLTMHLAQEFAAKGVRVNAVCPGPVDTDMTSDWNSEYRARVTAGVPLGRLGTPDEIAAAVAFLASDEATFITGAMLNANGGTLMG